MGACRMAFAQRSPAAVGQRGATACAPPRARADCLEQLLEAFRDILDRDDIHQAARRLTLVQQWICEEAATAAADPIFADLPTG
ncbi:MAG: hypothetical protein ACREE4_22550 [Stellaceae bacterium]